MGSCDAAKALAAGQRAASPRREVARLAPRTHNHPSREPAFGDGSESAGCRSGVQLESTPWLTSRSENFGQERENTLGYVIAAYGIVIGSLGAYALWIRSQRRKLMARGEQDSASNTSITQS